MFHTWQTTFVVCLVTVAWLAMAAVGNARQVNGLASYYAGRFDGKTGANGCVFHANDLSAASRSLPLGTWIKVTNLRNGRSVIVPITDRGPYIRGRTLDLSRGAAAALGAIEAGVVPVSIEVLPRAPRTHC
jgi:rare lipoprotein A